MTEFKKIFDIVLKVTPFAYILGFFVINGYLTNYNFSEYNILNLTFLKTGILLITLLTLVILSIYFCYRPETMSDDLRKSWPSILLATYILHILVFLMTPVFLEKNTMFEKNPTWSLAIILLKLFLVLYMFWASYKKPRNTWSILIILVPPLILMGVIIYIYSQYNSAIYYLWIGILIIGAKTALTIGDIGDNNYRLGMTQDVIFLIVFAFLFGKYFYPKIPTKYGGGAPYKIALTDKPNLLFDSTIRKLDTFYVIYENDSKFFLLNRNQMVFSQEKSELKTYIILKNSR
ncbi:hypothetical protein [Paraflavitalea sp. CAU 1676]|uniref:hypothetical protein n=1 Tax=Paraflavitalea sp. CAU 1676 TaxID=3032598 RepID=UPI0023DC1C62|nr:hypothetical protein [Paraflavitalea sp. CAU 1676]MDF2188543.1 hypothetical protein [Paraflavitalea sp. CAU 1676]